MEEEIKQFVMTLVEAFAEENNIEFMPQTRAHMCPTVSKYTALEASM
jgi:hypothetical protein